MRPCFDFIALTVMLTEEICNLKVVGFHSYSFMISSPKM